MMYFSLFMLFGWLTFVFGPLLLSDIKATLLPIAHHLPNLANVSRCKYLIFRILYMRRVSTPKTGWAEEIEPEGVKRSDAWKSAIGGTTRSMHGHRELSVT